MIVQLLLIVSFCLSLGIFLFVFSQRHLLGKLVWFFLGYILGVLLWGGGILINMFTAEKGVVLEYGTLSYFFSQVLYLGAGMAIFFLYYFFRTYQNKNFKLGSIDTIALVFLFIFTISCFIPNVFFTSLTVETSNYVHYERSWGVLLMTFYIVSFYFLTLRTIFKRFKSEKNLINKNRLRLMMWTYFLTVTSSSITNWFLPVLFNLSNLNCLGPSFYVIEASLFLYAVTNYRFLNIKLTLLKIIKSIVAFLISIFISVLFINAFFNLVEVSITPIYSSFLKSALSIILYFQFRNVFSSEFFVSIFGENSLQVFQKKIENFKAKRFTYDSIDDLETHLIELFVEELEIRFAKIVSITMKNKNHYGSILNYFEKYNDLLVMEEIPYIELDKNVKLKISKDFSKEGEIFIPLINPAKGIIGILVLGKKRREIYVSQELETLRAFGHYVSLFLTGVLYNSELKKEVKHKTNALNCSNKKLKILDEAKDDFLSMVSHEMRTPMTIIKGYSSFLLTQDFGKLNKKQLKFVDYIKGATQELLDLVNDMLDLSKIEAGRLDFEYERVAIIKILKPLLDGFAMRCKSKDINFEYEINSKIPKYIILDLQKFRLILNNLLGNAFKFTEKKGEILFKISKLDNFLKIEISDNGVGIAEDNISKIFKSFNQFENSMQKNHKGSGLGLSIVKKILDNIGGDIKVWSKEEKGTKFVVTIPIGELE